MFSFPTSKVLFLWKLCTFACSFNERQSKSLRSAASNPSQISLKTETNSIQKHEYASVYSLRNKVRKSLASLVTDTVTGPVMNDLSDHSQQMRLDDLSDHDQSQDLDGLSDHNLSQDLDDLSDQNQSQDLDGLSDHNLSQDLYGLSD